MLLIMILHLDPGEIDFAICCGSDPEKQECSSWNKTQFTDIGCHLGLIQHFENGSDITRVDRKNGVENTLDAT